MRSTSARLKLHLSLDAPTPKSVLPSAWDWTKEFLVMTQLRHLFYPMTSWGTQLKLHRENLRQMTSNANIEGTIYWNFPWKNRFTLLSFKKKLSRHPHIGRERNRWRMKALIFGRKYTKIQKNKRYIVSLIFDYHPFHPFPVIFSGKNGA